MRKSIIICLALMCFALTGISLMAQTMEYAFSATQGTFSPITGGLSLGTETTDDQRFLDPDVLAGGTVTTGPGLPIGFNFTFNNYVFDRLAINANGWISLGSSALTPAVNNSSTSGYTPLSSVVAITPDVLVNRISALGRDLQSQTGGSLRLETIGTAPNRVCVVQWTNYKKFGTTGTGDSFSFQIRLNETSNNIQLVYGTMTSNATAGNMQVGLRGPLATDFNARATSTSWTATVAATANTEFCVLSDTIFPPTGYTFNFNFPVANQPPNPANIVNPANNATLVSPFATVNWMSGGGLPSGYKISFGTNNPPTNIANNTDLGNVVSWDPPGELAFNTTYYWRVVPYNAFGDATNCPVWQFTTHGDGSIQTLPYTQHFDAVTAPAIPFDWTALVQSSTTAAYIRTVTTTPQSAPNCVALFNSTDLAGELLLIAPPLHQSLSINNTRVRFWVRSGGTNYNLSIGVISNPANPATYQEVQNIQLPTTTWTEHVVSLAGYTGTGTMLAFRHPHGGTGRTINIDNVTIELIAQNDLAITAFTGNTTPSVNSPVTYTASVFNWGSVVQTNYTVKLFNSSNVELASVAGAPVAPGATVQVPMVWTPTTEGAVTLYAKVFLVGDQNPTNDQSANLNVLVMGAGVQVISIGDGTTVNTTTGVPTPYGTYYKNFHQQYLYTASDILLNGGGPGIINAIAFNVENVNTCSPMPNFTIKVKHTTQTQLTTTFEVGDYQTVWVQNDFLPVTGWNTHPFTTPFVWDGVSNLLIDIVTTMIPGAYTQNASVYYTATTGTNTALRYQSDSVDAGTSLTGTVSVNRANLRLSMTIGGTGSLSGVITSGGSPVSGVSVVVNNTIFNTTTNTLGQYNFPFLQPGDYTVTASKLGYETQTLPVTITVDQATVLNINLISSSTVNVSGTVVGSDNPGVGLSNASITLTGPLTYTGTTNASGQFTVTGVLSGNAYNYTITRAGYQNGTGTINLGAANYNMGTITLNELTLPPVQVQAELNQAQSSVTVTWRPPGSTGGFYFSDFDTDNGGWVPSSNWTNPLGDWEWTATYNSANFVATESPTSCFPPVQAYSGSGLWGTKLYTNYTNAGGFSYLTQSFDFTGLTNPVLRFWNWNNSFGNFDYGQVAVNGTVIWGPAWHTAPYSWQEVVIPLTAYGGMSNVSIQFQHYTTTVVAYAGWYMDDVYIGPPETLAMIRDKSPRPAFNPNTMQSIDHAAEQANLELERSAASVRTTNIQRPLLTTTPRVINDRIPVGYKVWRLLQGNEQNEATWNLLTTATITDTFYVNTGWQSLADGHYKWAVKTVYTNNVVSNPAFSNMIRKRPNDLSALAVNGTTTPTTGVQTTYTVTIKNTGTQAQNAGAYTVKLMSGTTELSSVSGPALAVNAEAVVSLNWTPTTPGPMAIFGKTVHTGDTMPDNDNSPILNITVMPAGVVAVTVGDGTQLDGRPFEFLNNNSLFQTLYYPHEIGRFGNITALSFYNSFTTNFTNKPIKIWLGSTTQADLSGGWILPSQNLTLVYDGTANFPSGLNTITIPLQTPFQYTSGNLVLYANRPMDTVIGVAADDFKVQTVGTNRARKLSSNTVTYDPAAPSAVGTLSGQFPMTTFHMTAIGTNPIYTVTPSSRNFGTVLIETTHNQVFTISNAGGGTLTISNITIAGSPHFSLQNLPTLPASLAFGETLTFTGRYLPTAEGNHTATISITDNMTRDRLIQTIALSGTCIDTQINTLPYVQNFDTVTTPNLPVDWNRIVQATVTTAYVQTYTTTPQSAPNCAGLANSTDANATLLLIAPPYANTIQTNTTRVKFFARSSTAGVPLQVGIMSDYTNATTFTQTQSIQLTTTWAEYVVTFAGYTGTGRYVAFKHGLGGTSRIIYIDNVMLEVTPENDLAALSITGNSTPTAGVANNYTVNVFNWGTNAQSNYQVKLFTQGNVEVASVAGPNIAPGATVPVQIPWIPAAQGSTFIYGKVVLTGDQNSLNDQTANFNVFVQPPGIFSFTIGDGSQTARIPLDFFYKNSLHQYIIYPAEIGSTIGMMTALGIYNNFPSELQNMPTKIWIGTTTQTDLSAGWIPVTNHSLVFDGTMTYPTGTNTITYPFNNPYLYLNGENIVITFQRPMDTQYYSSTMYFQAQTGTALRARNLYSDSVTYDPLVPPTTGTATGQFAKTTIFMIPGGVGHLNGTVLGVGNQALANVSISSSPGGYTATTNAQGAYTIMNMLPNTYQLSFSRHGYITQTQQVVIEEDETETLNVTMQQMPIVTVSGTMYASDTGAGINGASISLTGYESYTASTNTQGVFTIAGVYANNTYNYTILAPGYQNASGTITVGATNHNMGDMILNEVAYAPRQVNAEITQSNTVAALQWLAPDPTALDLTESFESATFPPADWVRTVTNTGPANTSGVFPTWSRFGTVTISGLPIAPTEGSWQAGLWWDYNHQDEWLITPQFNCPPAAYLRFDSHVFLGSENGDHYYIKITTDGGTNWTVLWDASTQTGGWNSYASPIVIDLSAYEGLQVKLAWHAEDPASNDGIWYVWFIDNVYIGNEITSVSFNFEDLSIRSNGSPRSTAAPMPIYSMLSGSRNPLDEIRHRNLSTETKAHAVSSRALIGYRVWRLTAGQETNENAWTSITPTTITISEINDTAWATLANGTYRWAVKAVYTSEVLSVPSFSNPLVKQVVNGTIAGVVRTMSNQPISGVTVTAGAYTATTNTVGAYSILLPIGTYSVTATKQGFQAQTIDNVLVNANQTTTLNFILGPVSNDDELIPVTVTELTGNYPNPFNPSTTIAYALKDAADVRLEIYNLKGQMIRSLVNQSQSSGRYNVVWNGTDESGRPVSSGIYFYRFSAGSYSATRKMLLVE